MKERLNWGIVFLSLGILFIAACSNGGGGGGGQPATFTLSGSLTMPGNTAVDSDVNDAWENVPLPVENNSFASAQTISAPVILGGFVTTAAASECAEGGRLCDEGDPNDFFKLPLNGDLTISLHAAEPSQLSASLNLYAADQTLLKTTTGNSSLLTLTTTNADGDYYVEVRAIAGASNYILSITATLSANARVTSSKSADFIPGELIVRFKDDLKRASSQEDAILKAESLGLTLDSHSTAGPMLARIQNDKKETLFKNLNITSVDKKLAGGTTALQRQISKRETLQVIKALRKRSDVLYAEPNYIRKALATDPNDSYYSKQWNYPLINLPDAWAAIPGSTQSVVVAVVDTGVLMNHPDLAGQLTSDGYDFISDPNNANDGDGMDENPDDPGDSQPPGGSSFHGTHVSGIIAAASNNNSGVAGVTWKTDTRIMPLRVLGIDGGDSYDIIQAVKYAAGLENSSGQLPSRRADIINLSLGGPDFSNAEAEAYQQARDQGIIIIAAAGNDGTNAPLYPASYDSVISVSAVGYYSELADYSNFGATIDVAAPGGNESFYLKWILSTWGDDSSGTIQNGYGFMQGTSMAAPHVAGVAALMKAIKPELTPIEFDSLLENGYLTIDIGDSGKDDSFGYGLIDAYNAVLSAQDMALPTEVKVTPKRLYFDSNETSKTLTAQLIGTGSASITAVDIDVVWMTITPSTFNLDSDSNTETPVSNIFNVQIERPDNFLDGLYSGTITITTDLNTISVPVIMEISSSDLDSNAGYQYVALLDSESLETRYMTGVAVENGVYQFQLNNVAEGKYFLIAGSDMDNDGEVGELGEACGQFLSLDQPVVINVISDLNGLDFVTGFQSQFPSLQGSRSFKMIGGQKFGAGIKIKKLRNTE